MAGKTVRSLITKWGFSIDDRPLKRIDSRVNNLKTSLRGLGSLSAKIGVGFGLLSFGIGRLLQEAGNFEQVEVAFEVLTQSTTKAKTLMADLIDFAVKTPFTLVGVTDSTKQLLAYGIEAEDMIDTLTALGNVAAAVGKDKLPNLTLAFGQVRAAGRLRGQEVRQFTEAGVPINDLIAKEFGIAKTEVQDFVSTGKVSFERFNKAFQELANGTGRFTGLMERQSKTLLGVYSNLKDAVQILAISVGKTLVPEAKEYLNIAVKWLSVNKKLIQQNIAGGVKAIVEGMKKIVKVARAVFRIMKAVVNIFGGFEQAVRLATIALSLFVGVRVLGFLGNMGLVALSAAKNLLVFVAATRTAAVALLSLKIIALAIPLLIGAAIAAFLLLVEDFVVFMQGGDSIIGGLVDNFDKAAPAFINAIEKFGDKALVKVKEFFDKVNNFISGEEFAPQRERLAKGLAAMLDIAIVGTGLFTKIGFKIGLAIVDGMVAAFAEVAPGLTGILGIKSASSIKRKNDFKKQAADVLQAQKFIDKHGIEGTQKVFPKGITDRAQGLRARLNPDLSKIRENPEALKILINNSALTSALTDGNVSTSELIKPGVATGLSELNKAIGNTTFNTTVTVEGSQLDKEQLEQAITSGVNNAQMKTARDIATQAQSSIAE